jgi:hypothetical protein
VFVLGDASRLSDVETTRIKKNRQWSSLRISGKGAVWHVAQPPHGTDAEWCALAPLWSHPSTQKSGRSSAMALIASRTRNAAVRIARQYKGASSGCHGRLLAAWTFDRLRSSKCTQGLPSSPGSPVV